MLLGQQKQMICTIFVFSSITLTSNLYVFLPTTVETEHQKLSQQSQEQLQQPDYSFWQENIAKKRKHDLQIVEKQRREQIKTVILSRYRVDEQIVDEAIDYAFLYEKPIFPRAEHIMAIIGIESSWRPYVRSQLEHDPAVGLTQIRPGIWKNKINDPKKLEQIKYQIKYSIEILDEYYRILRTPEKTLLAYNVGITALIENRYNDQYLKKYNREFRQFINT